MNRTSYKDLDIKLFNYNPDSMIRIKIIFSLDRIAQFEHEEESKILLVADKHIDPMPAVPRIGDLIDSKILPIPIGCTHFQNIDWVVKYVEWTKDKEGYYVKLCVKPE